MQSGEYQLCDLRPMLIFFCSVSPGLLTDGELANEAFSLTGAVERSSPGTGLVGERLSLWKINSISMVDIKTTSLQCCTDFHVSMLDTFRKEFIQIVGIESGGALSCPVGIRSSAGQFLGDGLVPNDFVKSCFIESKCCLRYNNLLETFFASLLNIERLSQSEISVIHTGVGQQERHRHNRS